MYEAQIQWYLENFVIPDDYREQILEAHRKLEQAYDDTDKQRARLKTALERLGERYDWEHITKDQYLAEYDELQKQLKQLAPVEDKVKNLDQLANFLVHVADAWKMGTQEQLNRMANVLFEEIWIEDSRVVEVKPRDELKPFFQLSFEEYLKKSNWRPRGDSTSYLQDLEVGLFPVIVSVPFRRGHNLPPSVWSKLAERHRTQSLRQLAKEYGVSHEAIRRTLAAAQPRITTQPSEL